MITLYIDGKAVGTWAEAEKLFAESAGTHPIEFRDGSGRVIATSRPGAECEPDWVSAITPEETQRRLAGEFVTTDELRERLGWK